MLKFNMTKEHGETAALKLIRKALKLLQGDQARADKLEVAGRFDGCSLNA